MDPFMFVITEFCFDGCFSSKLSLILTAEGELLLDSLSPLLSTGKCNSVKLKYVISVLA